MSEMGTDAADAMRVGVVGLGFVGLTTALCLAEKGCLVRGYDAAPEKAAALRRGNVPFHEPGLPAALSRHLDGGFILADDLAGAVAGADYVFLCVGTPSDEEGGADLRPLLTVIEEMAAHLSRDSYPIVIVKSTVPPGTTDGPVRQTLAACGVRPDVDAGLVTMPEFLREGYAWRDALEPDRVVIGCAGEKTGRKASALAALFAGPTRLVSPSEAEFIKYLSNAFLATMISFSNEMAMFARAVGDIDVARAFRILHEDSRWHGRPAGMASYAFPGCGFGGYCLPKDSLALRKAMLDNGRPAEIISAVLSVNAEAKKDAARRIAAMTDDFSTPIGILGLSFKPGSDDVRDSPAAAIIAELEAEGYSTILAHDPMAAENFTRTYESRVEIVANAQEVVGRSRVIAIITAWPEYRNLEFFGKKLLDCRFLLSTGD